MATADTIIQEFIVIMRPYNLDFSEFVGSRAMLEAEGIMPEATMWPEGYNVLRWQDGTFDYRLRRQRPNPKLSRTKSTAIAPRDKLSGTSN